MRRVAAAFAAVSLAVACGDADPLPEDDETGVEVQSADSVRARAVRPRCRRMTAMFATSV